MIYLEEIVAKTQNIVGEALGRRQVEVEKGGIPALLQVLDNIGANGQALIPKIAAASNSRSTVAAIPTSEAVNLKVKPNPSRALPAVGVDGSQIYPEDIEPIWAYALAGAFATHDLHSLQRGRYLSYSQLVNADGYLLKNATDSWRETIEMEALAAAVDEPGWQDHAFLLDGSLLPWAIGKHLEDAARDHKTNYLKTRGALVASVVAMPKSNYLINLIRIAIDDWGNGVPDFVIAGNLLEEGERSALFVHGSPQNKDLPAYGEIYFFFLKVNGEILRVEVPAWVAKNPVAVEQIQASILADCLDGYPYSLKRAHNEIKIDNSVAEEQRERIELAYMAATGEITPISTKERFKHEARDAEFAPV